MHQLKLHNDKLFYSHQVQIENPQCLGNIGSSDKAESLHGDPIYYVELSLKRRTNLQPMKLNRPSPKERPNVETDGNNEVLEKERFSQSAKTSD